MPHDKKVNVDTLFDQAHEKQQLGRLPEAEALYRQAMALRPTVVLKELECYSEAAALFRQILAERPQYCGVWYNLVDCHYYDTPDHDDLRAIKSKLGDVACKPEHRWRPWASA